MTDTLKPQPDWFDRFWEEHQGKLPIFLRGQKKAARLIFSDLLKEYAPILIAYAKIATIIKGTRGVIDAPDPTPDQVAEAVQRLVERMKP